METFKYGDAEINYLKKKDKKLSAAIERIGMIKREVIPDLFTALVSSVVNQQISNKAAATVWNRLSQSAGDITAENLIILGPEKIQKCGMSMRKAKYIEGIAKAAANGELNINELTKMSDGEIIQRLTKLKGIGIWTAQMLMIFSMQRPDVISWEDLAIRRGLCILYGHKSVDKVLFNKYKKRFSPYGSVASLYLWAISVE